jgi:hypothetical protein
MAPTPDNSAPQATPSHVFEDDPLILIRAFERQIRNQEDILYGVALLFEGIAFLYAGQEALIETHRKQLRNIIQIGRQAIDQAIKLLEQVRRDTTRTDLLKEYAFSPCKGHPQPEELRRRAEILVQTYEECFAQRPRSRKFTDAEMVQLLDAAARKTDWLMHLP